MNDNATGVILENIQDKLVRLGEAMGSLKDDMQEVKTVIADIPEMKADIKVIKAVVTDHSRQLSEHEVAITQLKAA